MGHLLQLLLLLSLVVAAAKLAGAAASRVGQPAVFGEVLMGLILGPTLLNVLGWSVFGPGALEPGQSGSGPALMDTVRDFADVGVILLMFVAGLETDLQEMQRIRKVAFWAATGGVILPMAGGALTAVAFGLPLLWEGIFIGVILTATSVSISAQTLLELGVLRTKEGSTILGAAVIDDVMGIIVLSVVVALARAGGTIDISGVGLIVLRMSAFFALAALGGRYFGAVAAWARRLNVSQGLLAVVTVIAFMYAWAAEYVGSIAAITGAYLAGVLFTRTPFKKEIDEGIHPLTYSVFVPVFFVSIGLQANGRELGAEVGFTIALLAVAVVGKALGCGLFARLSGFSTLEAARVGAGMISRGEVGLIVAGYGLAHHIIGREIFSASVIMVLVTTMMTPPLLRLTFPRRGGHRTVVVEETIADIPEEAKGAR
jgi:Kef-type K+ transport system membrane component KefB